MQLRHGRILGGAAIAGLAGALIAGIAAYRLPDRYTATESLRAAPSAPSDYLGVLATDAFSITSLCDIIRKHNLYQSERQRMPMEQILSRMRDQDIQIAGADGRYAGAVFLQRSRRRAGRRG